jgi:transcription-repair coupling factor (superfamily II helicase)
VGKLSPFLQFTADAKNPYFIYRLKANSREKDREVLETLEALLEEMNCLKENSCQLTEKAL